MLPEMAAEVSETQRTVWEILMEMESFKIPGGRRRSGSSGLGLGPGEGFRASQPPCGVGQGDALQPPKQDIACDMRVLRASDASSVGRVRCGAASRLSTAISPRVEVELLVHSCCAAGLIK